MSSGVKREDNFIPLSVARHQGIEAVSGPKLIAYCFSAVFGIVFGGMSATHTELP